MGLPHGTLSIPTYLLQNTTMTKAQLKQDVETAQDIFAILNNRYNQSSFDNFPQRLLRAATASEKEFRRDPMGGSSYKKAISADTWAKVTVLRLLAEYVQGKPLPSLPELLGQEEYYITAALVAAKYPATLALFFEDSNRLARVLALDVLLMGNCGIR